MSAIFFLRIPFATNHARYITKWLHYTLKGIAGVKNVEFTMCKSFAQNIDLPSSSAPYMGVREPVCAGVNEVICRTLFVYDVRMMRVT